MTRDELVDLLLSYNDQGAPIQVVFGDVDLAEKKVHESEIQLVREYSRHKGINKIYVCSKDKWKKEAE